MWNTAQSVSRQVPLVDLPSACEPRPQWQTVTRSLARFQDDAPAHQWWEFALLTVPDMPNPNLLYSLNHDNPHRFLLRNRCLACSNPLTSTTSDSTVIYPNCRVALRHHVPLQLTPLQSAVIVLPQKGSCPLRVTSSCGRHSRPQTLPLTPRQFNLCWLFAARTVVLDGVRVMDNIQWPTTRRKGQTSCFSNNDTIGVWICVSWLS